MKRKSIILLCTFLVISNLSATTIETGISNRAIKILDLYQKNVDDNLKYFFSGQNIQALINSGKITAHQAKGLYDMARDGNYLNSELVRWCSFVDSMNSLPDTLLEGDLERINIVGRNFSIKVAQYLNYMKSKLTSLFDKEYLHKKLKINANYVNEGVIKIINEEDISVASIRELLRMIAQQLPDTISTSSTLQLNISSIRPPNHPYITNVTKTLENILQEIFTSWGTIENRDFPLIVGQCNSFKYVCSLLLSQSSLLSLSFARVY